MDAFLLMSKFVSAPYTMTCLSMPGVNMALAGTQRALLFPRPVSSRNYLAIMNNGPVLTVRFRANSMFVPTFMHHGPVFFFWSRSSYFGMVKNQFSWCYPSTHTQFFLSRTQLSFFPAATSMLPSSSGNLLGYIPYIQLPKPA
ncbi:hypothetical protein FRX31_034116, partial [Thalictrum thalictroides]